MLSGQQVAAVRRALQAGAKHKQIMADYGLARSSVEYQAKLLGLQRRAWKLDKAIAEAWRPGLTPKEVAFEVGCHPESVRRWLRARQERAA